jgi:hypothetical protein
MNLLPLILGAGALYVLVGRKPKGCAPLNIELLHPGVQVVTQGEEKYIPAFIATFCDRGPYFILPDAVFSEPVKPETRDLLTREVERALASVNVPLEDYALARGRLEEATSSNYAQLVGQFSTDTSDFAFFPVERGTDIVAFVQDLFPS